MLRNVELAQDLHKMEPSLTDIGGHRPVHDIKCLVKFVLDGWVRQHLV